MRDVLLAESDPAKVATGSQDGRHRRLIGERVSACSGGEAENAIQVHGGLEVCWAGLRKILSCPWFDQL